MVFFWFRYQASTTSTITLSGYLFDKEAKKPVEGAFVVLEGIEENSGQVKAATDANGYYNLSFSSDKKYTYFRISKEGYVEQIGSAYFPQFSSSAELISNNILTPGSGVKTVAFFCLAPGANAISMPLSPDEANPAETFAIYEKDPDLVYKRTSLTSSNPPVLKMSYQNKTGVLINYDANHQTNMTIGTGYYLENSTNNYLSLVIAGKGLEENITQNIYYPNNAFMGIPFTKSISAAEIKIKDTAQNKFYNLDEALSNNLIDSKIVIPTSEDLQTQTPTPTPVPNDDIIVNNTPTPTPIVDDEGQSNQNTLDLTTHPRLTTAQGYLLKAKKSGLELSWGEKIGGKVIDSQSGQPLADVEVSLSAESGQIISLKTDTNGNFTVTGNTQPNDNLVVSKEGYQSVIAKITNPTNLTEIFSNLSLEPGEGSKIVQMIGAKQGRELQFGTAIAAEGNYSVKVFSNMGSTYKEVSLPDAIYVFDTNVHDFVPTSISSGLKAGQVYSLNPSHDYTIQISVNSESLPQYNPDETFSFVANSPGSQYYLSPVSENEPLSRYKFTYEGIDYDLVEAAQAQLIEPKIKINERVVDLSTITAFDMPKYLVSEGEVLSFTDKAVLTFLNDNNLLQPSYDNGYMLIRDLVETFTNEDYSQLAIDEALYLLNSCYPSYFDRRATDEDRQKCLDSLTFRDYPPASSYSDLIPTPTPALEANISKFLATLNFKDNKASASTKNNNKTKNTIKSKTKKGTLEWLIGKLGLVCTDGQDKGKYSCHKSNYQPPPELPKPDPSDMYLNANTKYKVSKFDDNLKDRWGTPASYRGPFFVKKYWKDGEPDDRGNLTDYLDNNKYLDSLYNNYFPAEYKNNRNRPEFTEAERKILLTWYQAGLKKISIPNPGLVDITLETFWNVQFASFALKTSNCLMKACLAQMDKKLCTAFTKEITNPVSGRIITREIPVYTQSTKFSSSVQTQRTFTFVTLGQFLPEEARTMTIYFTEQYPESVVPLTLLKRRTGQFKVLVDNLPKIEVWNDYVEQRMLAQKVTYRPFSERDAAGRLWATVKNYRVNCLNRGSGLAGGSANRSTCSITVESITAGKAYEVETDLHELVHVISPDDGYLAKYAIKHPYHGIDSGIYAPLDEMFDDALVERITLEFKEKGVISQSMKIVGSGYVRERDVYNFLVNKLIRIKGYPIDNLSVSEALAKRELTSYMTRYGVEDGINKLFNPAARKSGIIGLNESYHDKLHTTVLDAILESEKDSLISDPNINFLQKMNKSGIFKFD